MNKNLKSFLFFTLILSSFQSFAECVTTTVSGGGGSWTRLVCFGGGANWGTFLKYVNNKITVSTASGRNTDGDQKFFNLTHEQKCDTIKANQPANCSSRPDPKLLAANGCTMSPDSWSSSGKTVNFTNSCNAHDNCYGKIGASRGSCDTNFKGNLTRDCAATFGERTIPFEIGNDRDIAGLPNWDRRYCDTVVEGYYYFVNSSGGSFYNVAQNNSICNSYFDLKEQYCE